MSDTYNPNSRKNMIVNPGGGKSGSLAQSNLSRIIPRQISTGTMRGTQNVGYGSAKIDGSNNRITVGAPDGSSVGMGTIPDGSGEFGFFSLNAQGDVIMKIVGGTLYVFDPDNDNNNVIQVGLMTNDVYGAAFAKSGEDLEEALA